MKLLTNLLFEPRGKHDPALAYSIKDTVMSADGSQVYFALQDVPAGTALDNEDYWKLQIDLSASKNAMDDAVASFGNYAKVIGTRVKGETAKASGNPVSFLPDAGSLLMPVTVLEPQQEGSGDPYPAGGGRNLCDYSIINTSTQSGITATLMADGSPVFNGTATDSTFFYSNLIHLEPGTYTLSGCPAGGGENTIRCDIRSANGVLAVDTGASATFTVNEAVDVNVNIRIATGYKAENLNVKAQLEAGSIATEYAPYENIRPFIGYDELVLTRAGKNLFNPAAEVKSMYDATYTYTENTLRLTNTSSKNYQHVRYKMIDYAFVAGKTLSLSIGKIRHSAANQGGIMIGLRNRDDTRHSEVTLTHDGQITYKVPENAAEGDHIFVTVYSNMEGTTNPGDYVEYENIQLEIGESATPYEPYQSNTYTVQIGETVYGGRFDWLTGKGLIEWKGMRLLGRWVTASMKYVPGYVGAWMGDVLNDDLSEGQETILCSHLIGRAVYDWARDGVYVNAGNTIGIQFSGASIPGYTDTGNADQNAGLVSAYLDANDVWIAWKLATPIEIQPLPPTIISAADPEQNNTLYGDGSIEVEYVKPLHVSIEERVAAAMSAVMNTEGE